MKTPDKTPHLAWRIIEGQAFIVNTETSHLHELNVTATFIWQHIDGKNGIAELASLLSKEYDITPADAANDLSELLVTFRKDGLIL